MLRRYDERRTLSRSRRFVLGVLWPCFVWTWGLLMFIAATKGNVPRDWLEWFILLGGLALAIGLLKGGARLVQRSWIEKDSWTGLAVCIAPLLIAATWWVVIARHRADM